MPQGDDFITTDPTPAGAPVDPEPAAAGGSEEQGARSGNLPASRSTLPASSPDPAASAPADSLTRRPPGGRELVDPPALSPTGEVSAETPDEPPDAAQRRRDAAFTAQRRENAALKARLAALEAKLTPAPAAPPQPAAPAVSPTAVPQPEQFASHTEYVQAVATWAVQQHEHAKEVKAEQTAITTAWDTAEAEAKTKHPDYDEVIAADTTRYHPVVLHAIQTSASGAEVAYHLATHPEEAQRIAALAPAAAVRALGRLEAQLETKQEAGSREHEAGTLPASRSPLPAPEPTPTPTPKPRPLTPVGGAGSGGASVAPDAMDYDTYTAWYSKTFGSR